MPSLWKRHRLKLQTENMINVINILNWEMVGKIELIRNVLTIKRYAGIATIAGAGLGTIYYFLTMSIMPIHFDIALSHEPIHLVTSIILTGTISALGGINIALIAYKINRMKMINSVKTNSSAVLGGAFAAFTPGCPACTAPLAVILGAVGGLSIFPMQGLELKMISVGVLVFSIYWITRGLQNRSCCKIN